MSTFPKRPSGPVFAPKMTPSDNFRNDTGMTVEEALEILDKGSVELKYGDGWMLRIQSHVMEGCRKTVQGWSVEERHHAQLSVDRALRVAWPKVKKQTASRKRMDNFAYDLTLWYALKEVVSN